MQRILESFWIDLLAGLISGFIVALIIGSTTSASLFLTIVLGVAVLIIVTLLAYSVSHHYAKTINKVKAESIQGSVVQSGHIEIGEQRVNIQQNIGVSNGEKSQEQK